MARQHQPHCFCQRPSVPSPDASFNICATARCTYRISPTQRRSLDVPPAPGTPVTGRRSDFHTPVQAVSSSSAPSCNCPGAPPALSRTSQASATPGKPYFLCARAAAGIADVCGFFRWGDSASGAAATPALPSAAWKYEGILPPPVFTSPPRAPQGASPSRPRASSASRRAPSCKCAGAPAAMTKISRTEENPGRPFWVCARPLAHVCGFFEWQDEDAAAPASPGVTYAQQMAGGADEVIVDVEVPNCFCPGDKLAVGKVSQTTNNPGREFWVCAKPASAGGEGEERCKFFAWKGGEKRPRTGDVEGGEVAGARVQPFAGNARPRGKKVLRFTLGDVGVLAANFLPGDVPEALERELVAMDGVKLGLSAADVRRRIGQDGSRQMKVAMVAREGVISAAERFGVAVEIDIPDRVLSALDDYARKEARRKSAGDEVRQGLDEILPANMCEKLMEFQWEGIHFALSRGGKALIADDMGLGKTLQAIAVARIYRGDWPLLIICPSSLRLNWKDELLMWLGEDIDEDEINVVMKGPDAKKSFSLVNIVSYDLAQKVPDAQLNKCGMLVCDESHYLKSIDAKRTKFVIPLVRRFKRALLLSGTPALSRPVELYSQVSSLEPQLFPSMGLFTERYCNAHHGRWGWDVSGSANLGELNTILKGSCLIRRKKEDVLTQLPAKQRGIAWVETNSKVMKEVRAARSEYDDATNALDQVENEEDALQCRNAQRTASSKLYKLSGEAKIDSVVAYVRDVLESTHGKILVFAHHKDVIHSIDEFVRKKAKQQTIVIDGSTAQHLRQGLCKTFQTNPAVRVAVLSITAAGVGLTLTAASQVIFAELYWNPGSLLQAEDRAHRIGQKDCVMVKYLLAKDTHDQTVWDMVRDKLMVVGNALAGTATKMAVDKQDETVRDDGTNAKIGGFFGKNQAEEISDDDDDDDDVPRQESMGAGVGSFANAGQGHRLGGPVRGKANPHGRLVSGTGGASGKGNVINLDSDDDDVFPVDLTPSPKKAGSSHGLQPAVHLDADLAFARRLQEEFDAEAAAAVAAAQ